MPAHKPFASPAESALVTQDIVQFKDTCPACQRSVNADGALLSDGAPALCSTCTDTLRASPIRSGAGLCLSSTALPNGPRAREPVPRDTSSDGPRLTFPRRRVLATPTFSPLSDDVSAVELAFSSDEDSESWSVAGPVAGSSRQSTPPPTEPAVQFPVATPSLELSHPQRAPFASSAYSPAFSDPISRPLPASPRHATPLIFSPGAAPATPPQHVPHRDEAQPNARAIQGARYPDPDPLTDITRLRMRPRSFRCLQPGATFKGVQKSGRSSYDVNVTLLNVDFASSTLCGYLRICGLTEGWPELTTYFDAEIVGMRYGFDTQAWGATRDDDLVHWSRFPAFKQLQNDLVEPCLTLPNNTGRNAVFMRWKERFLVPDHHVQDILGASFAGFYYVCIEFDPRLSPSASPSPPVSHTPSYDASHLGPCVESGFAPTPGPGPYPAVVADPTSDRWRSCAEPRASPSTPGLATMTGFYFHQNSEPYQQLSLTYVPTRFQTSCELR